MNSNALLRKGLGLIYLSFFPFGYGQTTDNIRGSWVENNPGGTGCPALALYSDNRPTVFALTEVEPPNGTTDFALYVLQQNSQDAATGGWRNDFPIYNLNQRELVSNLSLALNTAGSAFVTWVESKHQYGEPSIVIGTRGGAGERHHIFGNDSSKDAFAVSSVIDKQGNPMVAWSEGFSEAETTSGQIALDYLQQSYYPQREQNYSDAATYIQRWDGATWQDVGTPVEGHHPTLVLDKQDVPYLSYIRTTKDQSEAVVVYWDGQVWKQIGEAVSNTLAVEYRNLSLALDDNAMPIVGFIGLDDSGKSQMIVKQWDGATWQRLGENSVVVAGYNPLDGSLDYRAGKLVLATIEVKPKTFDFEPPQTLFVKAWDGERWQLLSDGPVSLDAACPVIQLDTQGNPHVAWSQIVGDERIYMSTSVKFSHFVRE